METNHPIVWCGDGTRGSTLNTLYNGVVVSASPSPGGLVIADINVPGVGIIIGARASWAGPLPSSNPPQPTPGTWLWTGAW